MITNFKKYKRFFAIGCSFTHYIWPTWADIIAIEMPDVVYYNLGKSGLGNMGIVCKLSEAAARYRFTEDDLLIIMWTTMCREDRWIKDTWVSPGNIFTQSTYDDDFVKKFADPTGYLIRDMALINTCNQFIKTLPCTTITLSSVPYDFQQDHNGTIVDYVLQLYSDVISSTPTSMFELELEGKWDFGHSYMKLENQKLFNDYHPAPIRYRSYLEKIGFPLTAVSHDYAKLSTTKLLRCKHEAEIYNTFKFNNRTYGHMF